MKVLVACEYSGTVRDAFLAKGHDAISCDLLPTDSPGPHYHGDITEILNNDWDLMIAHPPCTRLTNSGVRWLHTPPPGKTKDEMWRELDQAADFYKLLADANHIPMRCIENPIMHKYAVERIGRRKRQIVQPWYFGEKTFKATGFELHGLKPLKDTNRLDPPEKGTQEHKEWSWIHRASPGQNRWKIRSTTPKGIADAMADQWGGLK